MSDVKDNSAVLFGEMKSKFRERKAAECPLEPTTSGIVVLTDPDEEVTKGGIHLPASSGDDRTTGRVVVIGPDVERLEVGQHVLFGEYAGKKVEMNDGEWLLMNEKDVLAVIEG